MSGSTEVAETSERRFSADIISTDHGNMQLPMFLPAVCIQPLSGQRLDASRIVILPQIGIVKRIVRHEECQVAIPFLLPADGVASSSLEP